MIFRGCRTKNCFLGLAASLALASLLGRKSKCRTRKPPEKEVFRNPRGRKSKFRVRCPPEKEVFRNPRGRKSKCRARKPPEKEVFRNPRGRKKQVPGEVPPRKQKIFSLVGPPDWKKLSHSSPPKSKKHPSRGATWLEEAFIQPPAGVSISGKLI